MQRAQSLSAALLRQPVADPQRDPRWLQVRQFALTDLMRAVSLDELADRRLDADRPHAVLAPRQQERGPPRVQQGDPSSGRGGRRPDRRDAQARADRPGVRPPRRGTEGQTKTSSRTSPKRSRLAARRKSSTVCSARARTRRRSDSDRSAWRTSTSTLEMAPDNPKVHELKALALFDPGDVSTTPWRASTAPRNSNPKLLTPYQYRGELYNKLGQLDEANRPARARPWSCNRTTSRRC